MKTVGVAFSEGNKFCKPALDVIYCFFISYKYGGNTVVCLTGVMCWTISWLEARLAKLQMVVHTLLYGLEKQNIMC